MPTFDDPLADGEEARQALRTLAHARSFAAPARTCDVIGQLLGSPQSLKQVLQPVASARTRNEEFAFTDDSEH